MNIIVQESKIQFRNPNIGQPTKAITEHYNGRRIIANVDGEQKMYKFSKEELLFEATEDDMILAIEQKEMNGVQ